MTWDCSEWYRLGNVLGFRDNVSSCPGRDIRWDKDDDDLWCAWQLLLLLFMAIFFLVRVARAHGLSSGSCSISWLVVVLVGRRRISINSNNWSIQLFTMASTSAAVVRVALVCLVAVLAAATIVVKAPDQGDDDDAGINTDVDDDKEEDSVSTGCGLGCCCCCRGSSSFWSVVVTNVLISVAGGKRKAAKEKSRVTWSIQPQPVVVVIDEAMLVVVVDVLFVIPMCLREGEIIILLVECGW